jgi:hypothetical protein
MAASVHSSRDGMNIACGMQNVVSMYKLRMFLVLPKHKKPKIYNASWTINAITLSELEVITCWAASEPGV